MTSIFNQKYRILACAILFMLCSHVRAATTIDVAGSIDGSGILQVNNNSVSWSNVYQPPPTSLTVNGTQWNPSANPTMNLTGPLLPPDSLSNYFVGTRILAGGDIANAQIVNGKLLIYFDYTHGGADNYHIKVTFRPRPTPVPSPSAALDVSGYIDGSDTLEIRTSGFTWIHNYWSDPIHVSINERPWDTVDDPTLPNSGATAFLPDGVDLSSVVFIKNKGRDTATYQLFPDHIDVYFGDDPDGAGFYDVRLSFGHKP